MTEEERGFLNDLDLPTIRAAFLAYERAFPEFIPTLKYLLMSDHIENCMSLVVSRET